MKKNTLLDLLPLFLYLLLALTLFWQALNNTGGQIGYPVDDAFIHMAIARHFAEDGHWSVDLSPFTSASSSPLWTLLLGVIFRLGGVRDWAALLLSLLAGAAALLMAQRLLANSGRRLVQVVLVILVLLFTPLPVLALTGMEHALHALLSAAVLWSASELLAAPERSNRPGWGLLALCALLPVTRYEGLFLLFWVGLALLWQKRLRAAVTLAAAGASLMTLYGLISLANGWAFFPNSVLVKSVVDVSSAAGLAQFLTQGIYNLLDTPALFGLIVAVLLAFGLGEGLGLLNSPQRWRVGLFVGMFSLHLQLARVGWFFRYEAYLVFTGSLLLMELLGVLLKWLQSRPQERFTPLNAAALMLTLLLLLPLAYRGGNAFSAYPLAVRNIHEQQVQMARFVSRFYNGQRIVANDIGAISYYADIHLIDILGLANRQTGRWWQEGSWNFANVDDLAQSEGAALAILYPEWFDLYSKPAGWVEVGRWRIADNIVCTSDTVAFYALRPAQVNEIRQNLRDFSPELPETVQQQVIAP
ncbi:hypothetical protein BECAL_00395 [Bellilinea caldifistulae]|uniref:Glycosyltransferase RgtA/B/C/D-like domain-containing protein n=1 Tax=Bellilinea caldifistulae TaxID=360411 RepID=A0A0P6XSM8_9CHLR|nr:hypothetical protein [Bellilinea caldifistulae]KPL78153.1 hypothetical protein AC812_01660 [Bellilinea caldifistulae]GAP09254.1 hypothetical protein BECAL_00395 [Bellilinea caldifistulae]